MQRPTLIWFDLTRGISHADPDQYILEYFDVHHVSNTGQLDDEPGIGEAICIEFDYPDRAGLTLLRSIKDRYAQYPLFMLTMGHSERLAVWAYRNRVMDYLVKPVTREDVLRCKKRLLTITAAAERQEVRRMIGHESKRPAVATTRPRGKDMKLAQAVDFVQRNFRRQFRNAEVAECCDMSTSHFSRAFAETYSVTFQDFVLRYRIFEACRGLQHPTVPVADVANSVGFNDPSYFGRIFRRYLGMSPSEYCERSLRAGFDRRRAHLLAGIELPAAEPVGQERRQTASWGGADLMNH